MVKKHGQDKSLDINPGSSEGEEPASPAPVEILQEDSGEVLAQKNEEIKQLQDRILRMAAEMDNTRKRLERERSEGINFANECLIREILPVIDNLDRAVQHGEKETNCQSLLEGVRMTLKSMEDVLGKFGCVSFESQGKQFDPKYHEAVMQQESTEHPDKTVIQELQKGYSLRDRLIRPAMVVVSKTSQDSQSASD
jgi:molecular chaperone GrpE